MNESPILNTLYESRRRIAAQHNCYSGGSSGSSGTTTPQATPQQMIALYNQYLPSSLQTASSQVAPTIQALASGASDANPTYTAGGLSQLQNYAPGYQQVGADLSQQQAGSQNALLTGTGGQLATNAANLSNTLNPAQAAANAQAVNLVNSINLNGLSGGETAAVDRSLNQSNYATGNLGLDNATNAVSNAMNFGNALQAKRAALGSALNTATGVASNQNTFVNPVSTALNSGNTSTNFGLGTFNPTQANGLATAPLTAATSFGNQLAGVSSASIGTTASGSSQGGCYLTTACCEYMGLPDNCDELTTLRHFRDSLPANLVNEYYKVAPEIVRRVKNDITTLQYIYGEVVRCVKDIKSCKGQKALNRYMNMVNNLKSI